MVKVFWASKFLQLALAGEWRRIALAPAQRQGSAGRRLSTVGASLWLCD